MNRALCSCLVGLLVAASLLSGQTASQSPLTSSASEDYSGMYSFRREGEFVQITVEDAGRVTGFVSRFGDSDSDRGAFLNQFFKEGKLEGTQLSFTTEIVHGVWFQFKGTTGRGKGKTTADAAYHVLKGTLKEFSTDADKKVSTKSAEVSFESFPQTAQ